MNFNFEQILIIILILNYKINYKINLIVKQIVLISLRNVFNVRDEYSCKIDQYFQYEILISIWIDILKII